MIYKKGKIKMKSTLERNTTIVMEILNLRSELRKFCKEIIKDGELSDSIYSTICQVIDERVTWYEVDTNALKEYGDYIAQ